MKVFISWSGDLSGELASKLRDWFPNVIQRVQPYYTPKDIDKGARWVQDIASELSQSRFGIICVTPDNMESSWIMFEAGAISATFSQNKICPLLFGLDKRDLRGPLFQFQAVAFDRQEIKDLVFSVNSELGDDKLSDVTLDRVFEKWWPELESSVRETLRNWKPQKPPQKTDQERHAELLSAINQIADMRRTELQKAVSEDIFVNLYANIDALVADRADAAADLETISMLVRNVEFLHRRIYAQPLHLERATRILDRVQVEQKKRPPA